MRSADPGEWGDAPATRDTENRDRVSSNTDTGDRLPRDVQAMDRAMTLAASVRSRTSPNPWVGAVLSCGEDWFEGATEALGGRHAEVVALRAAGDRARGS